MSPSRLAALLLTAAIPPAATSAQTVGPTASPMAPASAAAPVDYRKADAWLCRPGRADACGAADMSATRVEASGKLTPVAFARATAPKIDCFYVYPTVSLDPTPNSDMTAGPEEVGVVKQQFARFASVCRTFAPLYRQVTLTALRAGMTGKPMAADRALAYADVRDAWRDYLAHDNGGRGVVLIGHSQGSGVLTQLLKEEIDGKPAQRLLVSAILGGTSLPVPRGADVGGALKSIPLCRRMNQTGCVVAFASFRADSPPPANSRFGKSADPAQMAACVNPAAPAGGSAELHPFLTVRSEMVAASAGAPPVWVKGGPAVTTSFVTTPGLLSGECVSGPTGSYLAVTTHPDPAGRRTDTINGDVVVDGAVLKDWGLHLIDMNLVMGDMLRLVAAQSAAWKRG